MRMWEVKHWAGTRYAHSIQEAADIITRSVEINSGRERSEEELLAEFTVTEVERDSHPCKVCGDEVTSNDPVAYPYCRSCHYVGNAANDVHMNELCVFRAAFPNADVSIEHTGGGCFWLSFRWEGEPFFYIATAGEASLPEDDRWADGWGAICRQANDDDSPEYGEERPLLPWREAYLSDVQGYTQQEVIEAITADRSLVLGT